MQLTIDFSGVDVVIVALCQRLVGQMDAAHHWIDGHTTAMLFDEDDAEWAAALWDTGGASVGPTRLFFILFLLL